MDKVNDPNVVAAVKKLSLPIVDPINKSVPKGLPEGKYTVRTSKVIHTIAGDALVFITYQNRGEKEQFMVPYQYRGESKTLEALGVPDLGNNDSRFWDVKLIKGKLCRPIEVKLTYDACLACDAGNDLDGKFVYDVDRHNWIFLEGL